MSEWRELKLGDVLTLQRGYDLPERERREGLIPIISSSGVTGYHDSARVPGPGVVIGRYGTLGEVHYTKGDYWPLNTSLYVRDFKNNHPRFISYLLKTLNYGQQNAAGAVPGVNRNYLHLLPVRIPDMESQTRIASVLSSYNDLIENNSKRIRVLEEMARSIFREWFVALRYPGHPETADSALARAPESWATVPVSETGHYVNGYAFKPDDFSSDGTPIVKIRELKVGVDDQTPRFQGDLDPKYNIRDGDLLFSWSADLNVYLWRGGPGLLNQHLFVVRPHKNIPATFLYYCLDHVMPQFRAMSNGATMKHIKRSALDVVQVNIATEKLRMAFADVCEPILASVLNLTRRNRALRESRDLLLPRLMSGELSVDRIPDPQESLP